MSEALGLKIGKIRSRTAISEMGAGGDQERGKNRKEGLSQAEEESDCNSSRCFCSACKC